MPKRIGRSIRALLYRAKQSITAIQISTAFTTNNSRHACTTWCSLSFLDSVQVMLSWCLFLSLSYQISLNKNYRFLSSQRIQFYEKFCPVYHALTTVAYLNGRLDAWVGYSYEKICKHDRIYNTLMWIFFFLHYNILFCL
jgi:hypothetical protein